MTLSKIRAAVAKFHRCERGSEAVESIAKLAIGAVVLYGLYKFTDSEITTTVETNVRDLLDISVFDGARRPGS